MQVPFIKYIEALVVGKESLTSIMDKLKSLHLTFPQDGLSIVHKRFSSEQPDYFTNKQDLEMEYLKE